MIGKIVRICGTVAGNRVYRIDSMPCQPSFVNRETLQIDGAVAEAPHLQRVFLFRKVQPPENRHTRDGRKIPRAKFHDYRGPAVDYNFNPAESCCLVRNVFDAGAVKGKLNRRI
jgi:hypothetical protein